MNIGLGLWISRGIGGVPGIQITTPAYLDPALMLVGDVIGDAYVPGVYPDFGGNPVSETAVVYYVDGAVVLSTYVLQAGDVVGAALVTLSATGAPDRNYYAEPTDITDFAFNTSDFTFTVPAGSGASAPDQFQSADWSIADDGTNNDATITITTLPADNGSAITDLEFQIDGGSWTSLAGTATGTYALAGLFVDGTASLVAIRAINASGPGTASATKSVTTTGVPAAFTAGMWSVSDDATGGDATLTITTLPSDSGSAITDLERKIGAGAWTSIAGTTTGTYPLTGAFTDGVATDVLVRAVNAKGNGPDSDTKSVTTTAASGPSPVSNGALLNTSTPGTSPSGVSSIAATAGQIITLIIGTIRNTGGSAMTVSATWNGENFTAQVNLLGTQGRPTAHILTLVTASSGTFTPAITFSNSAAAASGYYYVDEGQSGAPIAQTKSQDRLLSTGGAASLSFTTPNVGGLIRAGAMARFATSGISTLVAGGDLTSDLDSQLTLPTPANNLDGCFAAGHATAASTATITATFTPDVNSDIEAVGIEIF